MSSDSQEEDDISQHIPIDTPIVQNQSLLSLAFGKDEKIKETEKSKNSNSVLVSDGKTSTIENQTHSKAVFGGGLKRLTEGQQPVVSKRQKKKRSPVVIQNYNQNDSTDDDHDTDSDNEIESEELQETKSIYDIEINPTESTIVKVKPLKWSLDVVEGESSNFPKPTPKPILPEESKETLSTSVPTQKPRTPAFYVPVNRPEDIQIARVNLPIVAEEQQIMEKIMENSIIILCGETGSGKTTQVPQFLYEAGFGDPLHPLHPGMIGITQPRRVAAVSMATRVAQEMNLTNSGQVAHQVRYDSSTVKENITRIKFMTDGILLRELSLANHQKNLGGSGEDLLLTKYSCIIIDEAHERTVGTDILIGWLSRIVGVRNSGKVGGVLPLKLIIMSATLRVEDFTSNKTLFPSIEKPPVMKVDGRQYKVVVHFNKRTPPVDYVSEVFKKVCKIHQQLPKGGILIFLSGQQEIQVLCRKLEKKFNKVKPVVQILDDEHEKVDNTSSSSETHLDDNVEFNDGFFDGPDDEREVLEFDEDDASDDDMDFESDGSESEEEEVQVLPGASDDEDEEEDKTPFTNADGTVPKLHVLPLYSLLSTEAQMRIFEDPPPGERLCVIATNVAETSLTIPGIRYVVDCGKVKERQYDIQNGIQKFQIGWTSKASADQRAGRAGRVGPGHCYRIFSSAVFNDYFDQFQKPEIMRIPIEGVVLQMKSMGINQIVNFPFPTPPGKENLKDAEKILAMLGAVDESTSQLKITPMGVLMSKLPVNPRFAKMIILAAQQETDPEVLGFIIAIVSGLSVGDPFIRDIVLDNKDDDDEDEEETVNEKEERKKKRGNFYQVMQMFSSDSPMSDSFRLLSAIGAYLVEASHSSKQGTDFCLKHFIREKAMQETKKLRQQLTNIVKTTLLNQKIYPNVESLSLAPMLPPKKKSLALLKQIIFAGFPDQIARIDIDVKTRIPSFGGKNAFPVYQSLTSLKTDVLQIHPSSALFRVRPPPEYIVYEELVAREERVSADRTGLISNRPTYDLLGNKVASSEIIQEKVVRKLWMKGCTIVDLNKCFKLAPKSLCGFGKILEQPIPKYEGGKFDRVKGFHQPHYGSKFWALDVTDVVIAGGEERNLNELRMAYFGKGLLEGKVDIVGGFYGMDKSTRKVVGVVGKDLNDIGAKPSILTKSYSKTQHKVSDLLSALSKHNVGSAKELLEVWSVKPKFLLNEYILWVPEQLREGVVRGWPFVDVVDVGGGGVFKAVARFDELVSFRESLEKFQIDTDYY